MQLLKMSDIGNGLSIALSLPAIWIGLLVSLVAFVTLRKIWERGEEISREQKFILGIFISFVGGSLDSGYWLIPWSLEFIDSPCADSWFFNGYVPNIFFRQIADIIGGCLHLMALLVAFGPGFKRFVIGSTIASGVIGIAYVLTLAYWVAR